MLLLVKNKILYRQGGGNIIYVAPCCEGQHNFPCLFPEAVLPGVMPMQFNAQLNFSYNKKYVS